MKNRKNKSCKARWKSLEGIVFVRRDSHRRVRTRAANVSVEEFAKSVIIPPDTDTETPYGIPIDARLAINLISDFHTLLSESILKKFIDGENIDINLLDQREKEALGIAVNNLVSILQRSCAITIDKNVLMKTLSQPGCEGLRFYMCKKSTSDDYISLVTVGVDHAGNDHLYEYIPSNEKKIEKIASKVQTVSLVSEYGHPPGSLFLENQTLKAVYDKEPYVLLNYAMDITAAKRRELANAAVRNKRKKK